ncbi:SH3-like domain-containing protein [Pediococcus ethanolidurans]|uniref:SH3-like domain-containing protein n=1 Tax=Pediococcus ethanolidurans TaxID=319653 RepID=UPI001C1EB222|nr:SH3-like domain-containing protein [Pediococcus ethanolidurans]MBU7555228.1 SH3-like domain-containing protein [Pediococcus ethanolidurans]
MNFHLKKELELVLFSVVTVLTVATPAFASTTHTVTGNKAVSHTSKVVVNQYRSKSSNKRIYALKSAGHGRYTLNAKYYVHTFTKFTLQRTAKISGKVFYEVKSPSGYVGWIWSGYLGDPTTYYSKLSANTFQVKANATNNFYNHVPGGDYGKGKLLHYGKNYRNKTMTVTGEAQKVYKTHYYRLTYKGKNFGWVYGAALQKVSAVTKKTVSGVSVYTQSAVALKSFDTSKYSVVKNTNYFVNAPSTYGVSPNYPSFSTTSNTIKHKSGNGDTDFTTDFYLPSTFKKSGDFGNAQSVVIDGDMIYVMNEVSGTTTDQGFVVKYDLAKLRTLAKSSQDLSVLRRAAYNKINKKTLTSDQQEALKCVTVGPTFTTGHGQAMAMNPKNKQIWFIGKSGASTETSNIQELNKTSLRPDKEIDFKMGQNQNTPSNLTFDNNGNFYAYVKNAAKWAPTNSLKLYKGVINSNNTVQINLVMQGLKYAPGTHSQSIGFNSDPRDPRGPRLYFVADGSISSVPVNKIGSLSSNDVRAETFQSYDNNNKPTNTREFEGLVFDTTGAGYLFTLRGVELMRATSSNF